MEAIPSTVEIAAGSRAQTRFERGRDIYNYRCYFCHGYAGDAKTLAKTYLDPPPRDFTSTPLSQLPRERMLKSVTDGRMNTGMAGFGEILSAEEIELVVDFVREAFMGEHKLNTRYHTVGNGWPNHERFATAFPFATGEIALDTPVEQLTPQQVNGRILFMNSCITCHDRAQVNDEGDAWTPRPVSFPRAGYDHRQPDAISGATPYSQHDVVPMFDNLTALERKGEGLFQQNCAFCHAANGTGKNWIGSFMEPPARDLTQLHGMTSARLGDVIRNGLVNTSMPAWRGVFNDAQIEAVAAYVMRAFIPQEAQAKQR